MLDSLSPHNIFFVFIALLCERRIIFSSSSLGRLSDCSHAALAMLFPFTWQHIFIPIIPQSLINYCCAPMPFVIGVHSSMMKQVQSMPLEKVSRIDVK